VALRSIENEIVETTETVKVQALGKGELYEQCQTPSDAPTVVKRPNGFSALIT
jgi:hypothetical protein